MATAETARLIASLELKDNLSKGVNSATASIGKLEGKFNRIGGIAQKGVANAVTNITRLGIVGAAAIGGAVSLGIRSLADLARTEAQTNAVIASTGAKAGQTAASIREQAEALEKLSTVDDKVIQDGANMLLTFTSIGGKVFPQATKAALNMAVAMAGGNVEQVDLKASAIQLGKALNDPTKGMTALRKVGVAFTKQQQDQIKALQKSGDLVGAQTIILKELETEFGNAAAAAGKGPEASWRRLQDVGEDLTQTIARGLLPVLTRAADWLSTKLADPAVVKVIDDIGQSLGRAGDAALKFIETVDFKSIADSLGVAVGFAKGIVDVFMGMPDWVKQAVVTGWGLNKLTGGAVVDFGKLAFDFFGARGSSPANPMFVSDVAGGLGGNLADAATKGGLLATLLKFIPLVGIAAAELAIADAIKDPLRDALGIGRDAQGRSIPKTEQLGPLSLRIGESTAAERARLLAGIEGLTDAIEGSEMFGPPKPGARPVRPVVVDSPRTSPASLAQLEAILERGRKAGFKPTLAAAQATNQKNLERLASRQIEKTEAVRNAVVAADTRSEIAGVRMAVQSVAQKQPIVNVTTNVNVSAASVKKSIVIQKRFGPSGGSRERSGPLESEA